jgi:hypothetical protein
LRTDLSSLDDEYSCSRPLVALHIFDFDAAL